MTRTILPFLAAAVILLVLTVSLWRYEDHVQREPYIFQYQTIVPSGGFDCDQDKLAAILTWGDERGEQQRAHIRITEETIAKYGPEAYKYFVDEYPAVEDERSKQLQRILKKMLPHLQERNADFQIHLLESTMVNAFTTIGNHIFFTTALYDLAENDDERAMVIGHELGHQENGHVFEVWERIEQWEDRLKGKILWWEYDLSKYAELIGVIEDIATTPFGQPDEKEADLAGAYLTYRAGYSPELGVGIFHKFKELHKDFKPGVFLRLLRSHPLDQERIDCLDHYIAMARLRAEQYQPSPKNLWEKLIDMLEQNHRSVLGIASFVILLMLPLTWSLTNELLRNGVSPLPVSSLMIAVFLLGASSYSLYHYANKNSTPSTIGFDDSDTTDIAKVERPVVVYTTEGVLNVRQDPSLEANIVFQLKTGQEVWCEECCCLDTVAGRKGKWCRITTKTGESGWSWGWHLQLIREE